MPRSPVSYAPGAGERLLPRPTLDLDVPKSLPAGELRRKWVEITGRPVPKVSPAMLRLALAWELQAKAYGGLSKSTQQRLDQLSRGKSATAVAQPGMRLVREWRGKVHVVTIGGEVLSVRCEPVSTGWIGILKQRDSGHEGLPLSPGS